MIVLAACGTDAVSVPLVAPGQQKVFAYAIGYGAWHSQSGSFDGTNTTYDLELDGDYTLAMVCVDDAGTYRAAEVFGTLDDAPITIGSWQVPDCTTPPVSDAAAPMVEVSGDLVDATHVAFDGNPALAAPTLPWHVETSVAPGTHDVILWGDTAMQIDRDVAFDMSRNDLGELAVAPDGALIARPYDVPVVGDEMATAFFQLTTANGTVMQYAMAPADAFFPPAALLRPTDTRQFEILAYEIGRERGAILSDFDETPPDVDLLPQLQLPYAPNDELRVHWTPFVDFFTSATITYSDQTGTQSATVSKLWLDRHAGADIAYDEVGVPHYDPSWHVTAPAVKFTVERWSPGEMLFTTTPEGFLERPGAH